MAKSDKGLEVTAGRTKVIVPNRGMRIKRDIEKGNLQSAYAVGTFDEAKAFLESKGYRIISFEEQAGLRVQEGVDSSISTRGNWVREGFLYVPDKGAFLTKNSPVMANAKQATDCHRSNREFYLDDSQVESALANSVNIANTQIPTNRFADDALTNFAFGKNAKAYGEFLGKNGIDSMQVYLASSEYVPFAKQAWLCRISSRGKSGLSGSVRSLDFDDAIRGVREPGIEQE